MTAFLTSLVIVVLAETGDKTQLLAMAFATRFRWQTVMLGVLVATLANHFFAVVAGNYVTHLVPMQYVKAAASASFIFFGVWTLRADKLRDEDKRFNFGPFWTVALSFFLAEMGDKTQLATVALAAEFNTIVPVWAGTTAGMVIADAGGIFVGNLLRRKVSEKHTRWFAASVFIIFGLWGLYFAMFPSQ